MTISEKCIITGDETYAQTLGTLQAFFTRLFIQLISFIKITFVTKEIKYIHTYIDRVWLKHQT